MSHRRQRSGSFGAIFLVSLVVILVYADLLGGGKQALANEGDGDTVPSGARTGSTTDTMPDLPLGHRPPADSVEAGLWMVMDDIERKLRRSGRLLARPEVTEYLKGILCRLSPQYCEGIRIYVVRNPVFNATMAPNGVMQVWTGLLLRCENEAQLAAVLGHELAHYVRRHSLQRWRNVYETGTGLLFLQVLTSAAGYGFVGNMAQLIAMAAIYGYSRDQEREADRAGFEFMVRAGYSPDQAAEVWNDLIAEHEAAKDEEKTLFFATHPPEQERFETLRELADQRAGDSADDLGGEAFHQMLAPYLHQWAQDELRRRKLAQSRVVFERLADAGRLQGLYLYYLGEAYRQERTEEAAAKALALFFRAADSPGAPPERYRSLGLLYWERGEGDRALEAFKNYLAHSPATDDREMIESYIKELE